MTNKLNRVLAVERATRPGVNIRLTELHKITQKSELMGGFEKTYRPAKDDDTRIFPPESKKVEINIKDVFIEVSNMITNLLDLVATKDAANCIARGDIVVDGAILLPGVPSATLLSLDKQLIELREFVYKISELDPSIVWTQDKNDGLFKAKPFEAIKTEKVQEPVILSQATKEHPAQTQMVTKDIIVGYWTTTKHSGAISSSEKKMILGRIQQLINGVKGALEQANMTDALEQHIGATIFGYIFKGNV